MVDLSKVSQAVRKAVADISNLEGKKGKIDTKAEYDKLGELLGGTTGTHNKEYIEGFMMEYETKEAEKAAKERDAEVSDYAKELVKKHAKAPGADKKSIDSDSEAMALAAELNNTKGDLSEADINFIKNVLIRSGYGHLLEAPEPEGPNKEVLVVVHERIVEVVKEKEDNVYIENDTTESKELPSEPKDAGSKPTVKEKPPVYKKPPIVQEPPIDEPSIDEEVPIEKEAPIEEPKKELTKEEIEAAKSKGRDVADFLVGYTTDAERRLVTDIINKEINSDNVIEFMRGYQENSGGAFFDQMRTESGYDDKQQVMHKIASDFKVYLENKYGIDSEKALRIAGILVEAEFTKAETDRLDRAVQEEV